VGVVAVRRIGLERDLERRGRPVAGEPSPDRGDRAREAIGPPQRRRPAADVDRNERPGKARRACVELGEDRREVRVVLGRTGLDREVAVRTPLAAPRVVEVDA
jgi:hypothetical protein